MLAPPALPSAPNPLAVVSGQPILFWSAAALLAGFGWSNVRALRAGDQTRDERWRSVRALLWAAGALLTVVRDYVGGDWPEAGRLALALGVAGFAAGLAPTWADRPRAWPGLRRLPWDAWRGPIGWVAGTALGALAWTLGRAGADARGAAWLHGALGGTAGRVALAAPGAALLAVAALVAFVCLVSASRDTPPGESMVGRSVIGGSGPSLREAAAAFALAVGVDVLGRDPASAELLGRALAATLGAPAEAPPATFAYLARLAAAGLVLGRLLAWLIPPGLPALVGAEVGALRRGVAEGMRGFTLSSGRREWDDPAYEPAFGAYFGAAAGASAGAAHDAD